MESLLKNHTCTKSKLNSLKDKVYQCGGGGNWYLVLDIDQQTIIRHYKWHIRVDSDTSDFHCNITCIFNQLSLLHGEDHSLY